MLNILQADIAMCLRCRYSYIPESAAQRPSLHCLTLDDDDIPPALYINQESEILENISVNSYKYSKGLTV